MRGTPDSRRLCEQLASESGGCCLLAFSRGKDAIACWLWARQFFSRIIPFHCAVAPHMPLVDRSLDYYEQWFGTPILRCMSGNCLEALTALVYQPVEDEEAIEALDPWSFNVNEVADVIRAELGKADPLVRNAWCAVGITMSDSLERRMRYKRQGLASFRQEVPHRLFYPMFDWTIELILETIVEAGISLPEDYRIACRTIAGIPGNRDMDRLATLYPDDFARVELMFPLVRACLARNEFRRMKAGVRSK